MSPDGAGPAGLRPQTNACRTAIDLSGPWMFRLGDQAAVVPSLAGDGIATALLSGRLAASLLLSGSDAHAYHGTLRAGLARPVGLAMTAHWVCRTRAQPWAVRACEAVPVIMRLLASWTRVPA